MKYSRLIAATILLSSFIAAAPFAFAQTDTNITPPDVSTQLNQVGQQDSAAAAAQIQQQNNAAIQQNLSSTGSVTGAGPNAVAAAAQALASAAKTPANPGANTTNPYTVFGPVFGFLLEIFAWLLGAAGVLLNDAVLYTVVGMGTFVNKLSAVGVTWRVMRDIGNIILIFGFLAIGISTIIGYENYGEKRLPMLLVVALLLNFSLFFSEAIIDAGNIFATQFYTQITGTTPAPQASGQGIVGGATAAFSNVNSQGIANAIVQSVSLQTLYNVQAAGAQPAGSGIQGVINSITDQTIVTTAVFAILLFIIAAFVMFSLAFLLIARFIVLIILIAVAPVGFAGLIVPGLDRFARQWWDSLLKNTITAPVLLLLLYVALAVITDANFLGGLGAQGANLSGAATAVSTGSSGVTNFANIELAFLIAMGLLLAIVVVAKQLSAFGASRATSFGSKVVGGAIGYGMFGTASVAGRSTFGLVGRGLNNKRMQAWASSENKGIGKYFAKTASFVGRNLENRTYDARNIPGVSKAIGGVIGATGGIVGGTSGVEGIGGAMGKGATVTAKQAVDSTKETIKKYLPFSGDWWRDGQKEYEKSASEIERKKDLKSGDTKAIKDQLKKMSTDEITELRGIRTAQGEFVKALSPAQYAELQKSPKLLKGEKAKLKQAWNAQFDPGNVSATMRRFNTEEVAGLDGDTLRKPEVAAELDGDELDLIRRKGNLNRDRRHDIYTALSGNAAFNSYLDDDKTNDRRKYWNV